MGHTCDSGTLRCITVGQSDEERQSPNFSRQNSGPITGYSGPFRTEQLHSEDCGGSSIGRKDEGAAILRRKKSRKSPR